MMPPINPPKCAKFAMLPNPNNSKIPKNPSINQMIAKK